MNKISAITPPLTPSPVFSSVVGFDFFGIEIAFEV